MSKLVQPKWTISDDGGGPVGIATCPVCGDEFEFLPRDLTISRDLNSTRLANVAQWRHLHEGDCSRPHKVVVIERTGGDYNHELLLFPEYEGVPAVAVEMHHDAKFIDDAQIDAILDAMRSRANNIFDNMVELQGFHL